MSLQVFSLLILHEIIIKSLHYGRVFNGGKGSKDSAKNCEKNICFKGLLEELINKAITLSIKIILL